MARYGYTFIQPIRGNGKFSDLRAWLIGAGFLISVFEPAFISGSGVTIAFAVPLIFFGYFFLSIAEDMPRVGLSIVLVLSICAQVTLAVVIYNYPDTAYWGAQLYVGVTLIWTLIFLIRTIVGMKQSQMTKRDPVSDDVT